MSPSPRVPQSVVVARLALLGLFALLIAFGPRAANPLRAQDGPDPTPVPGTRFDPYPHPFTQGALAYSLADRWNRTDLTYYFANCPSNISCNAAVEAVVAGFESWADLSTLTFQEVDNRSQADIELRWSSAGPELGRVGDVLAYATFPSDGGDVTFDDTEPWSTFDGGSFDLYLVATHEIGHALGLDHSSDPSALMYAMLTPYTTGIARDDERAIQALYGTPEQRRPDDRMQDVPQAPEIETIEVTGAIDDRYPYEIWEFDAFAGETLTFTMTATGGNLDPHVAVLTGDESVVLAESSPTTGDVAQVTYTFDRDGTYVVVATREGVDEGVTAGSYVLTLSSGDAAPPPPAPDDGTTIPIDIRSYTPMDICEVYVSPSEDTQWGPDLLNRTLTNGNLLELEVTAGTYDVLVIGCDGTQLEEYGIRVNQPMAIEVYEGTLTPYIYEA